MTRRSLLPLLAILALLSPRFAAAVEPTVGWLGGTMNVYPGLTVVSPNNSMVAYLVDNYGRVVNSWSSAYRPGLSVYLLENGNLLRTGRKPGLLPITGGGVGGVVQVLSWSNAVLWEFEYSSNTVQQHHVVEYLPNGNVLILAWELKTNAEAIAAGRNPALLSGNLWPEHVVEVQPVGSSGGTIVWEWHLWDHLVQDFNAAQANFGVVGARPERVDVNHATSNGSDWIHANSIDYNPTLDQIVISAHHFGELWVIDHSTTTAQAATSNGGNAGRGGDLLYRWGNPQTFDAPGAQILFGQHCVEWVPAGSPGAGNITIFNNGAGQPGPDWSTIVEIAPPLLPGGTYDLVPGAAYGPTVPSWTYQAAIPTDFYSPNISGVQRLPNGNTLICEGASGLYFEVNDPGSVLWQYEVPVTSNSAVAQGTNLDSPSFRAYRYGFDYPGFIGKDLTPGNPLESYGAPFDFDNNGTINLVDFNCFATLFTGPCSPCLDPVYANTMGRLADSEGDGDVDCEDWNAFTLAWSGGALPAFPLCAGPADFVRGDANQDGAINLTDPVSILGTLFSAVIASCNVALDANDDENLDISDPVYLFGFLFANGPAIPAPNVNCGPDPSSGALGCTTFMCP